MTATLQDFLHTRQTQTLGWTLLHSLWLLSGIAAAAALLLAALRRASASTRYILACAAMLLMAAAPVATFLYLLPPAPIVLPTQPLTVAHTTVTPADDAPAPTPMVLNLTPAPQALTLQARIHNLLQPALPATVFLYLLGTALMLTRLLLGYTRLRRLVSAAHPLTGRPAQQLETLAQRMRISRPIRLLQSAAVEVPTLLGALKPVILLPASALTGLSADQLTALLAHELAHIRRHDYLANIFQSIIETLLFYHPAVWWLAGRIRQEREHCCDDTAVALTNSPLTYAQALATMESLRAPSTIALAATGTTRGTLLRRIQRILSSPKPAAPRRLVSAWAALALMIAACLIYIGCNRSTPAPSTTTTTDTAPATLATSGNTHTYDVRYLLGPVANKEASQKAAQDLIDTIRATVAPETWKQNGGTADIHISDGMLTITQTRENFQKIDDLLAQLFQTRGLAINIESRAILVSNNFLDDFRVGWNLTIPQGSALQTAPANNATLIDNWTLNLLLTATQAEKRTVTLTAPRATIPNGYPVEIKLPLTSQATSNTVRIWNKDGQSLETLYFRATPAASADRRYVVLSIAQFGPSSPQPSPDALRATSAKDIASTQSSTASADMGSAFGSAHARFPTTSATAATMVSIPDGGTLLINGGPLSSTLGAPPDHTLLFLLRPNIVTHSDQFFQRAIDTSVDSRPTGLAGITPQPHARQVLIKSVILQADADAFAKAWPATVSVPPAGLPAPAPNVGLYTPEFQKAIDTLIANKQAEITSRPTVLANDGEKAVITIGQQMPYIKGFRTDPEKGRTPDVENLTLGIQLELRPHLHDISTPGTMGVSPEGHAVQLDLSGSISSLVKTDTAPAPDALPGDPPIQVPVIDRRQLSTSVLIANDETVMILLQTSTQGKVDLLLITPHFVPLNAPATAPTSLP